MSSDPDAPINANPRLWIPLGMFCLGGVAYLIYEGISRLVAAVSP